MANNNLAVVDGETLADMRLPPAQYCVKSLLHQGVTILGGAPKIGKSWLVLDLCVRVAKGESVFGLEVRRGTTLYLCLEDTLRRIQHRLVSLTDEAPANMFFSTEARTLTEGLCDQVREFMRAHPDTVLVAVDTFQVIRSTTPDVSYATDYQDVRELKKLADELGISILLVHHLRKQGASDPLNKLSGTTGIAGAVDAVLVLEKSDRCQSGAALICTGRDIEYRELELRFESAECSWELVSDSAEDPAMLLLPELGDLVDFMRKYTILYGRLSQEDMQKRSGREDDSNSIQNQRLLLEKYAADKGFTNTKFIYDDGYTGTNFNRPGWQEVMELIESEQVATLIVAIMYSRLFNLLCDKADDVYNGRLPVHVRCLLDEFANIGQIPKFDKLIATIRSREISASIILQSQSQLKTIYKDAADTISGNCDTMLFLGGKEKSTLKEISELLGKETIDLYNTSETRSNTNSYGMNYQKTGKELMSQDEIAVMDGGKCILQLRGVRPFLSDKFDITKHPKYKLLSDFNEKNAFDIEKYRSRKLVVKPTDTFDLYDVGEVEAE